MAHPGAYRGTKRQKELKRLQKQEEKRLKRIERKTGEHHPDDGVPEFPLEGPVLPEGVLPEEPSDETPDDTLGEQSSEPEEEP